MLKKIAIFSIVLCFIFSLVAIPVLAEGSGTSTTTNLTFDPTCIKNAIEKRDTAIITAQNAFNTSLTAALTTRKTELQAAWGVTKRIDRVKAIRAAWKNFTKSRNEARKTLRKAINDAWKQFNTGRKQCKASYLDDTTNSAVDN